MAEAFPNQEQFLLTDDSPCGSSGAEAEPHTPEMPHPIRAFLEDSGNGLSRKGLKQLDEMFGFSQLLAEKQNVKTHLSESEHAGKAEIEVQTLRKALADMQFDKDSILLQYKKSLENLSEMERELSKAQNVAEVLDERASKTEIEINIWKEALAELKSEKDAGLVQYNHCLERIASLEAMLSLARLDAEGHDERAAKVETEVKNLKEELAMLEAEKDAGLLQYEKSLEKISVLEAKIIHAEENSRMRNEQIETAELEIKALRQNLAELNEEKETVMPKSEDSQEEHVLENFHSSRTIRKLILDCPNFASTLWEEALKGKSELWAHGHSCKVISAFLESPDSKVQKLAKKELQPLIDSGILKNPKLREQATQ